MRTSVGNVLCIVAAALTLLMFSPRVQADYQCETKERDWPPAQRELFSRGALAMRTALLSPPEGWVMAAPDTRIPGGKMCADFKNDPATFGASGGYIMKPTADQLRRYRAAQIAQRKEIELLRTLPADVQSKVDALDAENTQLRKEAREAERAQNRELAKTKYAEAQDVSRKSYAVRNEFTTSIQAKEREIYKKYEKELELNRDVFIRVSMEANGRVAASDSGTERLTFGANTKTNQSTDKLVRIVANIERNPRATAEQTAIVRGLIDVAKLRAMVGGKIPSLEESQAAAVVQNDSIAQLNTKAREFERALENEGRREEEAAQIAKRQATEAERAGKSGKPEPVTAPPPAAATASNAPTSVAPPKPAPTPPPTDAVKEAKDAVNKLKGLFGR